MEEFAMDRVLVPLTDPVRAERLICRLLADGPQPQREVVLLAIVEPAVPGRIPIYLGSERASAMAREAAVRWLEPLQTRLEAAGIRARCTIRDGPRVAHERVTSPSG